MMDYNNNRVAENPNEDYKNKAFIYKPKNKVLRILLIPIIILIVLTMGVNIYMKYNDFDLIVKYSDVFDADPAMVASIIHMENKHNKYYISNEDANKLMQITYDTYRFISENDDISEYDFSDITKNELNIALSTYYYSYLYNLFDENEKNAICAYNAGPETVQSWLGDIDYCFDGENIYLIPLEETRDYLNRIEVLYPIYKVLLSLRI